MSYPEDFRREIRKEFSPSKTAAAYDILQALDSNDFGLGALLSNYAKSIKIECDLDKCNTEELMLFLSQTINALNLCDLESLPVDDGKVIMCHKIKVMRIRDAIGQKSRVIDLYKLWNDVYDNYSAECSRRVPISKKPYIIRTDASGEPDRQ